MSEPCPGCHASAGEPCRPGCLSHVTDTTGQPLDDDGGTMDSNGFRVGYVPAVATLEDRLNGRVGEPARVVVQHVSGWRIDWTEGARLADIYAPSGGNIDAVRVVGWEWVPPEGGRSRMTGEPPTSDDLAGALAEYVHDYADALGLPGLEGQ